MSEYIALGAIVVGGLFVLQHTGYLAEVQRTEAMRSLAEASRLESLYSYLTRREEIESLKEEVRTRFQLETLSEFLKSQATQRESFLDTINKAIDQFSGLITKGFEAQTKLSEVWSGVVTRAISEQRGSAEALAQAQQAQARLWGAMLSEQTRAYQSMLAGVTAKIPDVSQLTKNVSDTLAKTVSDVTAKIPNVETLTKTIADSVTSVTKGVVEKIPKPDEVVKGVSMIIDKAKEAGKEIAKAPVEQAQKPLYDLASSIGNWWNNVTNAITSALPKITLPTVYAPVKGEMLPPLWV